MDIGYRRNKYNNIKTKPNFNTTNTEIISVYKIGLGYKNELILNYNQFLDIPLDYPNEYNIAKKYHKYIEHHNKTNKIKGIKKLFKLIDTHKKIPTNIEEINFNQTNLNKTWIEPNQHPDRFKGKYKINPKLFVMKKLSFKNKKILKKHIPAMSINGPNYLDYFYYNKKIDSYL